MYRIVILVLALGCFALVSSMPGYSPAGIYCGLCKTCTTDEELCEGPEKLLRELNETIKTQDRILNELNRLLNHFYGDPDVDKKQIEQCGIGARMDGNLPNSAFRASSYFNNLRTRRPSNARLYLPNSHDNDGGWLEAEPYWNNDWLQIDLGEVKEVTGIVTQGQPNANAWVTTYTIRYATVKGSWKYVTENGKKKIFEGNEDYNSVAIRYFPTQVQARYIRFYTEEHYSWPALRVEIMGCYPDGVKESKSS